MIKYLKDFFTYHGRIGRQAFLASIPTALLIAFLMFLIFLGGMYLFGLLSDTIYSKAFFESIMFTSLVIIYFFPATKRLNDLNFSTWFYTPFVLIGIIHWIMVEDVNSKLGIKFRLEILSGLEMACAILTTVLIAMSVLIGLVLIFKKGTEGSNPY